MVILLHGSLLGGSQDPIKLNQDPVSLLICVYNFPGEEIRLNKYESLRHKLLCRPLLSLE